MKSKNFLFCNSFDIHACKNDMGRHRIKQERFALANYFRQKHFMYMKAYLAVAIVFTKCIVLKTTQADD